MTPGSCHVHGDRSGRAHLPGRAAARRREPAAGSRARRGAGDARESRPAPRTRPSRNAGDTASAPGSPGSGPARPTGRDVEVRAQAVGDQPIAREIERGAVGVVGVELALARRAAARRTRCPRPAPRSGRASGRPSSQRLTTSSSASHAVSWMGPVRELAAAQEPVVGKSSAPAPAATRRGAGSCRGRAGAGSCRRLDAAAVVARRPPGSSMAWPPAAVAGRRARPIADRSRARRNGFVPGLAEAGRAQLRPALEVVGAARRPAACRTTGSRTSRGTATRRGRRHASADAGPRVRRRHAVEGGRVEQLGQQLDAVHDPRSGPAEVGAAVDGRHVARADRGSSVPARSAAACRATPRRRPRGDSRTASARADLRVDLGDRAHVVSTRRSPSRPSSSQPPARRTCSGTQWPTANGGSSHSTATTRGAAMPAVAALERRAR